MRPLRPIRITSTAPVLAATLVAAGLLLPAAAAAQSVLPRPSELPPAGGPASPPGRSAPAPTPAKPAAQQAAPQKPAAAAPGPGAAGQPAPARPYASVTVTPPAPATDPGFEAFRRQLGEVAARKDRAALARLVARDFFWTAAQGEKADRKKPGIDNLAAAIGLDAADGEGWEVLTSAAADPTLQPFPQKKGVSCAPATPGFDDKAFEQLLKATRTDVWDWAYPAGASIAVRGAAAADAPLVETLGAVLVRVVPEPQGPAAQGASAQGGPPPGGPPPGGPDNAPPLKVVTPSGKTGFVSADAVLPLVFEQLCYAKGAAGWSIAGYLGGE